MSDAGGYDTNGGYDDGGYDGQRPAPILETPLFDDTTPIPRHSKRKNLCWTIRHRLNT